MKKGLLVLTLVGLLGITSCGGSTSEPTSTPKSETGMELLESAVSAIELNYTVELVQVGVAGEILYKVTEEGTFTSLAEEGEYAGIVAHEGDIYEYFIEEDVTYIIGAFPIATVAEYEAAYDVGSAFTKDDYDFVKEEGGAYFFNVKSGILGEVVADAVGLYEDFVDGEIDVVLSVNDAKALEGEILISEISLFTFEIVDIGETVIPEIADITVLEVFTIETAFAAMADQNFTVVVDDWKTSYYAPQGAYFEYGIDAVAQGAEDYGYVNKSNGIYKYDLDEHGNGVLGGVATTSTNNIYNALYTPYDLSFFDELGLFDYFGYDSDYDCYFIPLYAFEGEMSADEIQFVQELFGALVSMGTAYVPEILEVDIYVDMYTGEMYIQTIFTYTDGNVYYMDCSIVDINTTVVPGLADLLA